MEAKTLRLISLCRILNTKRGREQEAPCISSLRQLNYRNGGGLFGHSPDICRLATLRQAPQGYIRSDYTHNVLAAALDWYALVGFRS